MTINDTEYWNKLFPPPPPPRSPIYTKGVLNFPDLRTTLNKLIGVDNLIFNLTIYSLKN